MRVVVGSDSPSSRSQIGSCSDSSIHSLKNGYTVRESRPVPRADHASASPESYPLADEPPSLSRVTPAVGAVMGQEQAPSGCKPQVQGTRLVHPAADVSVCDRGGYGAEVRGVLGSRKQLHGAAIGSTVHPHPPVRALECRRPLDRIESIRTLVQERIEASP